MAKVNWRRVRAATRRDGDDFGSLILLVGFT